MRSVPNTHFPSRLLAACACLPLFILSIAGCSRHESATVQIDVSKSLAISGKARTPGRTPSPFTIAAFFDSTLERAIDSDEFRALPISTRFAKNDTAKHTRLLAALAEMCSCSVRLDPPAIRITVTASDHKEAATIANALGKAMCGTANISATADLAARRQLEHLDLSRLDEQTRDLQLTLDRLEEAGGEKGQSAGDARVVSASYSPGLGDLWARHELLQRELGRVRDEADVLRSTTQSLEDLSLAANDSAVFWIVPPSANSRSQPDSVWTQIPRLDRDAALFAVANPAGGSDWFAASLSESGHTLRAAVGEPAIATTSWFKSHSRPATTPQDGKPSTPDTTAAINDLSSRITLSPIGDGSIIALGLSGSLSPDDRRAILDALTHCIQAQIRADSSVDSVNRRELISQHIVALDNQTRDLEPVLQSLATRAGVTPDSIAAFYDSTQEGRDLERIAIARHALSRERRNIELLTNSIFDDVRVVRNARPPE